MNDLTASVESRGVRIESMSLISSVDTIFRKAKVEKPRWIICYRFALGAILVWEVNIRLMNGIQSFQFQNVHGFVTCLRIESRRRISSVFIFTCPFTHKSQSISQTVLQIANSFDS